MQNSTKLVLLESTSCIGKQHSFYNNLKIISTESDDKNVLNKQSYTVIDRRFRP